MKHLIAADIHAGYPNRLYNSLWALNVIKKYARNNDIDVVWVLGDLFHDRVSIPIDVSNAIYTFFEGTKDQTWICFPGNHDMYLRNSWKINSIKPLKGMLTIVEDVKALEIGGKRFFIIPFIQYESAYMNVLLQTNEKASESDVLMTHIGVADSVKNACFLLRNWGMVSFKDTKFKKIFTGHFHIMQQVGDRTYYPGSPIPYRFDDESSIHGFLVYDDETDAVEKIDIYSTADELGIQGRKPENFITILEDKLDQPDIQGNSVRVLLTKEYTDNELLGMRDLLIRKGARSVCWLKKIESESKMKEIKTSPNTKDLFGSWLDFDKPEGLNRDLLLTAHKQIAIEAEEIISRTEENDIGDQE